MPKRGVTKDHRRRKQAWLKDAGHAIGFGTPIGDTARKFNYRLQLILEQQVELFYGATYSDAGFTDKESVRRKIEEFHDDFKALLSQLSGYMGRFAREQQERQCNTLLVRHCLEVLELDPNGKYDHLALKSQYRKLARNYHPDHNGNENNPEAEDKMKDLNEAYGYLKEML